VLAAFVAHRNVELEAISTNAQADNNRDPMAAATSAKWNSRFRGNDGFSRRFFETVFQDCVKNNSDRYAAGCKFPDAWQRYAVLTRILHRSYTSASRIIECVTKTPCPY
jgi:hypothetical protein